MKTLLPFTVALIPILLCQVSPAQGPSDATQQSLNGSQSISAVQRSSPSSIFRLIVHKSSPFDEITKSRLSQVLLKKSTTWPDGNRTFPVDLGGRSEIREALSREIHGRSLASIKSYWQRQIFSGTSVPPPEFDTDQEILDFVRRRPGAIGYISSKTPFDDVKELFLVDE